MAVLPEVWLRGPVPHVPPLLQPVAHTLLQAAEEVDVLMEKFPDELLWQRPADVASAGFHLQHLTGVLDRLFTYAKADVLNDDQLQYLKSEGVETTHLTARYLADRFQQQVELSIRKLVEIGDQDLTAIRYVGRARIESTVIGLLVHAAEHTTRHVGQLLVTVKVLQERSV